MDFIPLTLHGPEDGGNFEEDWSNGYISAHLISDVGKKREHNEDSCALCAPEDQALSRERGMVFAVADGMGGASAGELASQLALNTFLDTFYGGTIRNIPSHIVSAIESANAHIYDEAENRLHVQKALMALTMA